MGRTVDGVDRRARSWGERSEARGLTGRVRAWRRSRRIGTSLLTVLALAATSGCDETEEIAAGGPTFDVDLFEQNIRDALDGETVGYAYAISEHGQLAASGANGFARTAVDGQLAQSAGKRTNIASVTKTITAVAVLQLLERRGLTIDSDIDPWIPADWTRGPGVDALTFADLLTHRSGLNSANSNFAQTLQFAGIRDSIATGVVNPQSYNYLNLNYAIFRILVPELWRGLPGAPSMADPPTANSSSYFYRFYVQQAIMDPIGVPLADCVQPPGTPATLFYLFGTVDGGVDPGDWSLMCGGGGYYLSAIDLVRFMVAIRYQDEILSPANRQVMDQELVGWCCNSSLTGDHGEYHSHGGALGYSSGAGMSSAIMKFPIEVEAALIINSVGGNHSTARTVLRDAFDAAWTD